MDGLICDAELAPQLLKMTNDKLQETRKALEVSTQERDALRVNLVRLQNAGTSKDCTSGELEIIRRQLEDALEVNRRLQGENADLCGLLEGCQQNSVEPGEISGVDATTADAGCSGIACQARHDANLLRAHLEEAQVMVSQQVIAYDELQERVGELQQQVEQSDATYEKQRHQIVDLQEQLMSKEAEGITYGRRIGELEAQLMKRDDEAREQSRKAAELQVQHNRKQLEFDRTEYKLQQELELVTSKYWRYKTALEQANNRPAQAAPRQPETTPAPSSPSAPSQSSVIDRSVSGPQSQKPDPGPRSAAPPPPASRARRTSHPLPPKPAASGATHAARVSRQVYLNAGQQAPSQPSWSNLKESVLRSPCFSITAPHAPTTLPTEVSKHFASGSTVLSCPGRISLSPSDSHAQLLAPLYRCKSVRTLADLNSPTMELLQMIGTTKEVFYEGADGISYMGTFQAAALGEVAQPAFAKLPKETREAIVKDTFTSKAKFAACSSENVNRLRNWYLTGKAKAQFLTLRFVGFNEPLYAALKAHAVKTGCAPEVAVPAVAGTKRGIAADAASSSAKKLKTGVW